MRDSTWTLFSLYWLSLLSTVDKIVEIFSCSVLEGLTIGNFFNSVIPNAGWADFESMMSR